MPDYRPGGSETVAKAIPKPPQHATDRTCEQFPAHVVCELGNSEAVGRKHYLQVTDEHFAIVQQAAQKPGAVPNDNGWYH